MTAENMVRRLKPIDYGSLQKAVEDRRNKAIVSAERVKQIQAQSRGYKAQNLHKQHYSVWSQEMLRLEQAEKRASTSLEKYQMQSSMDSSSKVVFQDFCKLQNELEKDAAAFKQCVIDPIFALREDLKYYLQCKQRGESVNDPKPIIDIIKKMRTEMPSTAEKLFHEENALLEEMEVNPISSLPNSEHLDDPFLYLNSGIPDKVWDLQTPDEDMKVNLLQEFIHIDTFHHQQWDELRTRFANVWERNSPEDWTFSEAAQFQSLWDGYNNFCMVNRYTLTMDAAQHLFPTKTHKQLVNMYSWLTDKRIFTMQSKAIIHDWSRSRQELTDRIRVTLDEAMEKYDAEMRKHVTKEQQFHLCQQLAEKVKEWREQKIQLMMLQQKQIQEETEKRRSEDLEQLQKIQKQREQRKEMISQYKAHIQEKELAKRRGEEEELNNLKEILEKQSAYDRERVQFRERMVQEKVEHLATKKTEEQILLKEKEKRLEELRQQVRPTVEKDPLRVLQPTKAWEVHMHKTDDSDDEEWLLNDWVTKFDLGHFAHGSRLHNTFTDKQILADPRCRVENALRDAGLIHSDYARSVLRNLPGAQQPRRDNFLSTNGDFLRQD